MIEIAEISKKAADYDSFEAFEEKYRTAVAESYERYIEDGHSWCWSLAGNIVQEHEYGEEREIKYGTKHFSRGTKVFIAPAQWGDGYEKIVVIGLPRHGRRYIEVITQSKYITNYRIKKVYNPAILKRMCSSQYLWWGDTDNDRKRIIEYLESVSSKRVKDESICQGGISPKR